MIKNKDDLDHLYFNQLRIGKYKELAKVLKKILFTISHGQALVGRGFSLNKTMLKDNIEQTSCHMSKFDKILFGYEKCQALHYKNFQSADFRHKVI